MGREADAEEEHKAHLGKKFPGGQVWELVIREDLDLIELAGIKHSRPEAICRWDRDRVPPPAPHMASSICGFTLSVKTLPLQPPCRVCDRNSVQV